MAFLKHAFEFYVSSSIHVALAVCAFTGISLDVLGLSFNLTLFGFIFFGTITGYNFVKYAGIAQLHHRSLTQNLKEIQIFSLLCFLCLIYFCYVLPFNVLLACIPLGLLTLFYAVPLMPKGENLRTTPTLKIFVIAAVWAGVTVYLPQKAEMAVWSVDILIVLFQRFLLVLALILPFEIRDLRFDSKNLGTLPQRIGTKKTKVFGYLLLIMAILLTFLTNNTPDELIYSSTLLILSTGLAIYLAKAEQSKYYASFWVEGIPIFTWLALYFI